MKFICSSSLLRDKIKEAFDVDAHCIQYYKNEGTLTFVTTKYQSDVNMSVERRYESGSETVNFNHMRMVRLYDLLKWFPEQPIVVEMDDDDIEITHCVIKIR